jgi:hypothetical protein
MASFLWTLGLVTTYDAKALIQDRSCGFTVEQIVDGALGEARRAAMLTLSAAPATVAAGCRKTWADEVDRMALHERSFITRIRRAHRPHRPLGASHQSIDCWGNRTDAGWRACCRNELGPQGNAACFAPPFSFEQCCAFSVHSRNHDDLPAIYEISFTVETSAGRLVVSQDGFLRPFDIASVLWPSGYLLTLFVANSFCSSIRGKRVLELGAGVGAPSVAAAKCGAAAVLATDRAVHSRLLTAANAAQNDAAVEVLAFDWLSDSELLSLSARGPWDVVMGAAILVESWTVRMWHLLEALLRSGGAGTSSAWGKGTVLLAHTADVIEPPVSSSFRITARVRSEHFGMRNRFSGTSDFEVVEMELGIPDFPLRPGSPG